jgi:hypothetical protein
MGFLILPSNGALFSVLLIRFGTRHSLNWPHWAKGVMLIEHNRAMLPSTLAKLVADHLKDDCALWSSGRRSDSFFP